MTDGAAVFRDLGDILGRRHRMSGLDPGRGTFELHDDDRTVRVTLEPELLAEYVDQLDEPDRVRVKRVAGWIEEIFESDVFRSLLEIRLDRSADGRISLVDRRGSPRRSPPPASTEPGYWSPDRPGP